MTDIIDDAKFDAILEVSLGPDAKYGWKDLNRRRRNNAHTTRRSRVWPLMFVIAVAPVLIFFLLVSTTENHLPLDNDSPEYEHVHFFSDYAREPPTKYERERELDVQLRLARRMDDIMETLNNVQALRRNEEVRALANELESLKRRIYMLKNERRLIRGCGLIRDSESPPPHRAALSGDSCAEDLADAIKDDYPTAYLADAYPADAYPAGAIEDDYPHRLPVLELVERARMYYKTGEYKKSIWSCRQALKQDRFHAEANFICVISSCRIGEVRRAARHFRRLPMSRQKMVSKLCELPLE